MTPSVQVSVLQKAKILTLCLLLCGFGLVWFVFCFFPFPLDFWRCFVRNNFKGFFKIFAAERRWRKRKSHNLVSGLSNSEWVSKKHYHSVTVECVYVHVHVHIHVYTCVFVSIYVCVSVCTCICVICVFVCMYVYVCACVLCMYMKKTKNNSLDPIELEKWGQTPVAFPSRPLHLNWASAPVLEWDKEQLLPPILNLFRTLVFSYLQL